MQTFQYKMPICVKNGLSKSRPIRDRLSEPKKVLRKWLTNLSDGIDPPSHLIFSQTSLTGFPVVPLPLWNQSFPCNL